MKFKTRLYIGFGFVLVMMIILAGSALHFLQQQHLQNEIVKEKYEGVKRANAIQYETNNTARMLRDVLLDERESEADPINQSRITASSAIDSFEKMNNNEEIGQLVTKIKLANDAYNNAAKVVFELAHQGKIAEGTKVLIEDYREVRADLVNYSQMLTKIGEEQMKEALDQSYMQYKLAIKVFLAFVVICFVAGLGITILVVKSITNGITSVSSVIATVAENKSGELPRIESVPKNETRDIALAFNAMAHVLDENSAQENELKEKLREENWLKTNFAEITTSYQGAQNLNVFAQMLISKLTPMVGACYGVLYFKGEEETMFSQLAAYAENKEEIETGKIKIGEGLIGQCALENKILDFNSIPSGSIKVTSGLIRANPRTLIIIPISFEGRVIAVIELASFESFAALQKKFLQQICTTIGVSINSIYGHMKIGKLLEESQTLTEELQSQSEELQQQQEELQIINEKLEEQYDNSEEKTRELEKIKLDLEHKNKHVEMSSKYKSEFLANMSHELRTPLNSMLILSELLSENSEGNLTTEETEYARTIYSSGKDLLNLINDILDLSKVETGNIEVNPEEVFLDEIITSLEHQFLPVANQKGIDFSFEIADDFPKSIVTDEQRFKQVLKNLLSNAFKFTKKGSVSVEFCLSEEKQLVRCAQNADLVLAIAVTDTGIGIPRESQNLVFEAFKQGDGTMTRMYGGTGLGLSISKEIVHLLGGILEVKSVVGEGSTFTVYLPYNSSELELQKAAAEVATSITVDPEVIEHESSLITAGSSELVKTKKTKESLEGKQILVVDDDMRNVFSLTNALEKHKMKVIFTENGIDAIEMLQSNPDIDLVLMDIMMPKMNGYEAMNSIRQIPEFESLPIIALTAKAMKSDREKCMDSGASDYISKPVNLNQLLSLIRVWLHK